MASIIPSTYGFMTPKGFSPFTMVFDTTNAGSANDTVIIPLNLGTSYDFTIDWDGELTETYTSSALSSVTHIFASSGIKTIKISGICPYINFNNSGDVLKLTNISQWGNVVIGNWATSYSGCSNLTITAIDVPDVSTVTNMDSAFNGATLANPLSTDWDVSSVTTMTNMFRSTGAANPDTSNWDTSSVTNMANMFQNGTAANPDVSGWDVSKVTIMSSMFFAASSANPDTTNWSIPLVTTMASMFTASGLSTANYDIFLNMASGQTVQSGVSLDAAGINYTIATSQAAHDDLVNNDLWVITDAGGV